MEHMRTDLLATAEFIAKRAREEKDADARRAREEKDADAKREREEKDADAKRAREDQDADAKRARENRDADAKRRVQMIKDKYELMVELGHQEKANHLLDQVRFSIHECP